MAISDAIKELVSEVTQELTEAHERVKASEPGESYERARFEFDVLLSIHKRLTAAMTKTAEEMQETTALMNRQNALLDELNEERKELGALLETQTELLRETNDNVDKVAAIATKVQDERDALRQQAAKLEAERDGLNALIAAKDEQINMLREQFDAMQAVAKDTTDALHRRNAENLAQNYLAALKR